MIKETSLDGARTAFRRFHAECAPLELPENLVMLTDERTNANYCECHLLGSTISILGTTDFSLDPEEQPDYKANREVEENSASFLTMKEDAKLRRSFSNIVAEWKEDETDFPIKIIGGQHRFQAIRYALDNQVDVAHGVKVYFNLDLQQRKDVQLISNTNIAVSGDLIDRIRETAKGSQLRDWCQNVGFLNAGEQFTDAYVRSGPISVRMARTFITNYFLGLPLDSKDFGKIDTSPVVYKSGGAEEDWEKVKEEHPSLWTDAGLMAAGKEFSELVKAQREYFYKGKGKSQKVKTDYPEKALNLAVIAAWAFIAGVLSSNAPRLQRHFELKSCTSHDPLNADALAKGRHTLLDPENYRGLGYRTDPQERGRLAELFFLQAEDGKGINKQYVDSAIKQFHAKKSQLEAEAARAKARAS